jgi:hypothetical protein
MKAIPWRTLGRLRSQTAQFAVAEIDAVYFTLLTLGIKRVAIGWIEENVKTVAAGESGPVTVANAFLALDATWPDPVFVVLKSARDPEVRFRIVQRDPVKFPGGNFV